MNKKFEYIDDNPGYYFGMLVEGFEDNKLEEDDTLAKPVKKQHETLRESCTLSKDDIDYLKNNKGKKLDKKKYKVEYNEYVNANTNKPLGGKFTLYKKAGKYGYDTYSFDDEDELVNYINRHFCFDESLTEDFEDMFENDEDYEQTMIEIGRAILNGYFHGLTSTGHSWNIEVDGGIFDIFDSDLEEIVDAVLEPSLSGITSHGVSWQLDIDSYFEDSLTEDKFVPQDKMSKKAQKELNDKKRGTWGNTNPVTRVQPNKKAYDRKRDSKVVDESKQLNEVRDFEWGQELWAVVKDNGDFAGNPCLSWEEAREISANHEGSKIYEMALDRDQINESVSKKDLYDALKDAYGMTKKEADKWIKDASEKSKEEIVKGFKGNAKKSFKYD